MTTPTVSGPGALSRRTDTGPTQKLRDLPDADYGEGAVYKDLQQAAGLGQSGGGDVAQGMGVNPAAANVVGMGEASMMPGTPVTDGANAGAGMGSDALGLIPHEQQDMEAQLPYLPVYEYIANLPNASWAARNYVRKLKGMV